MILMFSFIARACFRFEELITNKHPDIRRTAPARGIYIASRYLSCLKAKLSLIGYVWSQAEFNLSSPVSDLTLVSRYDTRCYFIVRSKADMSQLNLPHGNNN